MLIKNHNALKAVLKMQRFLDNPFGVFLNRIGISEDLKRYERFTKNLISKPELHHVFEKVDVDYITDYTLMAQSLTYLYDLLRTGGFQTVVECGSGASSLGIATAFSQYNSKQGEHLAISLESDFTWMEKTRTILNTLMLSEYVHLLHSPLDNVSTSFGHYRTYRPEIISSILQGRQIDFLFIDGPGPDVGRIGVIPLLKQYLAPDALVLLDDAGRDSEKNYVKYWVDHKLVAFKGYLPIGNGLALMRNL